MYAKNYRDEHHGNFQTVDKPHFTPEQPKAFPLRGRWREAPDEVEHVTNLPEVFLKSGISPHTSSVGLEADSFPSRGSLGCSFFEGFFDTLKRPLGQLT